MNTITYSGKPGADREKLSGMMKTEIPPRVGLTFLSVSFPLEDSSGSYAASTVNLRTITIMDAF